MGEPAGDTAESLPVLASFEFEGTPPCKGVPVVNGHRLTTVESFDVHMSASDFVPTVTLALPAADMLRLIFADKAALVKVSDETREALISLGWTPPDGDAPPA